MFLSVLNLPQVHLVKNYNHNLSQKKIYRLQVARVFHQQHDFDSYENVSHVVKPITGRVILSLTLTYKIDINNAFFNGDL